LFEGRSSGTLALFLGNFQIGKGKRKEIGGSKGNLSNERWRRGRARQEIRYYVCRARKLFLITSNGDFGAIYHLN
jgi:hypothetical protein